MKADVYNREGKVIETMELPDSIFGVRWKPGLVHEALRIQENSRRAPLAHAKGRGEVSGGGKKPWRQKGTGRARHGSIRSPIWKGGGVSHGPNKARSYALKMNKKERRIALNSLLSKKLQSGEVYIFDSFSDLAPKTKDLAAILRILFKSKKQANRFSAVVVPGKKALGIYRAARNLPTVVAMPFASLNVSDALRHQRLVIEKEALASVK